MLTSSNFKVHDDINGNKILIGNSHNVLYQVKLLKEHNTDKPKAKCIDYPLNKMKKIHFSNTLSYNDFFRDHLDVWRPIPNPTIYIY